MAGFLEDLAKAVEAAMKATNSTSDDHPEDPDDDEKKKKKEDGMELKDIAMGVGAAAGAGLLAWGTARLLLGSSSEPPEKQPPTKRREPDMVAPGKNPARIYRDEFEANPSGYFRGAREEKKLKNRIN